MEFNHKAIHSDLEDVEKELWDASVAYDQSLSDLETVLMMTTMIWK